MHKTLLLAALALIGCRDNGTGGSGPDMSATMMGTTTIAAARMGNVTAQITVNAVVTGLPGDPADTKEWYIQDPAGGPYSGVAIYCNKTAKTNPCPMTIVNPSLHDLVQVTGKLSTYKGKLELQPTAVMTMMSNATPPAAITVTAADLAASSTNAGIRGALVKIAGAFTVDSTTPMVLYDTNCAGDAGVNGYCQGCKPPTYSGFQVNDGAGNEILVENRFYTTMHLQSSMECVSQPGEIAVANGKKFSMLSGIADVNQYAPSPTLTLSPTADSDYTAQ